jgi:hypothetical protein
MTSRHMCELDKEAHRALSALQRRVGRTKKFILSAIVLKVCSWGPDLESFLADSVPQGLLESELFWKQLHDTLNRGIERCKQKHVK